MTVRSFPSMRNCSTINHFKKMKLWVIARLYHKFFDEAYMYIRVQYMYKLILKISMTCSMCCIQFLDDSIFIYI